MKVDEKLSEKGKEVMLLVEKILRLKKEGQEVQDIIGSIN